jgi:hypothetical protein
MHTVLRIIWMIILFELGVTLLVLPWLAPGPWDSNYFLSHYPALRPFLLQPSVRGLISGLGALDVLLAVRMLRRRSSTAAAPSVTPGA